LEDIEQNMYTGTAIQAALVYNHTVIKAGKKNQYWISQTDYPKVQWNKCFLLGCL